MSSTQFALYTPSAGAAFQLDRALVPDPGPAEILVRNRSLALNPFEHKIQKHGLFFKAYPSISGFSFAGIVEKVGSSVRTFRPGDRVVGGRKLSQPDSGPRYGAFQQFVCVQDTAVAKLHPDTALDDASAVVSNLISVVGAFNLCMGMERVPTPHEAAGVPVGPHTGKKILIYGGSSIFGLLASEYAVRAGYSVVTTSSPRNLEQVHRFCSPAVVVDHTMPVGDVVAGLVAAGPYDFYYDSIATPQTKTVLANVVKELGGGTFWSNQAVVEPNPGLPEGVNMRGTSYPVLVEQDELTRKWFFEEYLPDGLIDETITVPNISKIKGGLGSVPNLLDRLGNGEVSGTKIIVDPGEEVEV